ncbi:FAD-dependent oxidoreductase [Burkholderia gladioli]|uniref:FAD-dependent oxidoreductase n=1 Tax=Burkholderia gladioli TaxID=28095 RepID=UPI00163E2E68|nr:FAD-dependent oxidoreductase [Burkholderia gladioli]
MQNKNTIPSAYDVLSCYGAPDGRLFTVGTYDVGITVHSQQIRALNLAWALVETRLLATETEADGVIASAAAAKKQRIAIVGGGFAGLTLAAALLKKGFSGTISLFERRDALLPLQQGSDARWLHPRIYEWPAKGSELTSAALPLLNWTAGRASDVVVQVLREWQQIVDEAPGKIDIYCNSHHLQIHGGDHGKPLRMEWVADKQGGRSPNRGRVTNSTSIGSSGDFQFVILAVGFGLEKERALSYWRNETLAQPNLGKGRVTYIVSGQGDGALIDLLRLRIGMFRQDRILSDIFAMESELVSALEKIREQASLAEASASAKNFDLYEELEEHDSSFATTVLGRLKSRLRRDTQVILHVKSKRFRDLFDVRVAHISFQNRLLVYLLYKCGAFIPSSNEIEVLQDEYGVPDERVIRRHGTLRDEMFSAMLDPLLIERLDRDRTLSPSKFKQSANPSWSGGYFAFRGISADASKAAESVKKTWRKEYLPSATQLLASSFCASVAAYLSSGPQPIKDLRVTLHRALVIGADIVLQQCCDYVGTATAERMLDTARRVFPSQNGTIGMAHSTGRIVVSKFAANNSSLNRAMRNRNLNEASRKMSASVQSLLAIPLITAKSENRMSDGPSVACILYADAYSKDAFSADVVRVVSGMCQKFLSEMCRLADTRLDRMSNYSTGELPKIDVSNCDNIEDGFSSFDIMETPFSSHLQSLNFEHTDFIF